MYQNKILTIKINYNIMKHIQLSKVRTFYPVGSYMGIAIEFVNEATDIFLIEYPKASKINIWVRGSSGAILGALFANNLIPFGIDVKVLHIKKEGEKSHNEDVPTRWEMYNENCLNIILDDFIGTGKTVKEIYSKMKDCRQIEEIDFLIVNHAYKENVDKLNFIPKYLITHLIDK